MLTQPDNEAIKLTIGIPIYNGEKTISETLDSIFRQITTGIEVVISNNASTDRTEEIVQSYCRKYSQIKYHKNAFNLGYDKNVDLTVTRATGKYVWLMGDDDEIAPGGIEYIQNVIDKNPDLAAIFVNYSCYERFTGRCMNQRMLNIERDVICHDADSFLRTTTIYTNFISSIVAKRSLWLKSASTTYIGTLWIQFGTLLEIIQGQTAFCVATPYVMNRGVEFDGPNSANRYGVAVSILMNLIDIIDNLPKTVFTNDSIAEARSEAHKLLLRKIFSSKRDGLKVNVNLISRMIKTFGRYPIFWICELPIMMLPRYFHFLAWKLYKSGKPKIFFKLLN